MKRARFWVVLGALAGVGCPGVPLRPDGSPGDELCPKGAKEAMDAYDLVPGDSVSMDVDASRTDHGPVVVYDGPIESRTWGPMESLPPGVLLYGRVWTGGPRVIIRYYSAKLPNGKVILFCAVADWNGPGLPKFPGRPGSAAVPRTTGQVTITGRFR